MPKIGVLVFGLWSLVVRPLTVISVRAAISACHASVSSSSLVVSATNTLTFSVYNDDISNSYVWVRITAPSSDFTIGSGSASGWTGSVSSGTVIIFTGGSIGAGAGQNFDLSVTTGSSAIGSASWTVETSDSSDGSGATSCIGSLGVAITSSALDTTAPTLSDPTVSDVSQTSVKIIWTTDEISTSVVYYGTTTSYGSTKSDSSFVTSHSLELTDLSANTSYHFTMRSTDLSSNTGDYGDSTFTTSRAATTTTVTRTETRTETKTVTKVVEDTTKPDVVLTSDFTKIYAEAPKVIGKASDDIGITRVDYSLDGGKNWLEADMSSAVGAKKVNFEFTALGLEDGNYKVRSRAIDPSGNTTISREYILIIDRLPPLVGSSLISVGPQILKPDNNGVISTLPNLDQKITLSAIGGATQIELASNEQLFSLVKNFDNGLWSGTLSFAKSGVYTLETRSLDGAGNKTLKSMNPILVLDEGVVSDGHFPLPGALVSVYYKEPTLNEFVLWDGEIFGMKNLQKTSDDGKYRLILPRGEYFIEIKHNAFKALKTNIFKLEESSVINSKFTLSGKKHIKIGPIKLYVPSFSKTEVKLTLPAKEESLPVQKANLDQEVPLINLESQGKKINSFSFRGKPTVFSVLSTWLPEIGEQMQALEEAKSEKLNILAVLSQEGGSKASVFERKGDYKIPVLGDRDGEFIDKFGINTLPYHIFLDRRGIVRNVKIGVLSSEEIVNNLIIR